VLRQIEAWSGEYGLPVANVFHAGDGNLHPLILYDGNRPGDAEKTIEFGDRILELCIEVGGTVTGEHGVGVEKLKGTCVQFAPKAIERFLGVKAAFDTQGLLNPGKAVPTLSRCAEFGRMHVHQGQIAHAELPRF
jgi:glycolate oxidase